jgi:hypothetical protein
MEGRLFGNRLVAGALAAAALGLAACGGGGGGGGGGGSSGPGPSKLFVADSTNQVIGSVANANPSPGAIVVDRLISTPDNHIQNVLFIALDASRDQLYVTNNVSIFVYNNAGTATGNVPPSRTVGSPGGGGHFIGALYYDKTNDRLYAADTQSGVLVYDNASTASGVAPSRTIVGDAFGTLFSIEGVAVDEANDILYVARLTQDTGNTAGAIDVFERAHTLSGTVTADRAIDLPFATLSMFLDGAGNRLYVGSGTDIRVYDGASSKTGADSQDRTINTLTGTLGLAVDTVNDRLYAAQGMSNTLLIGNHAKTMDGAFTGVAALGPNGNSSFTSVAVTP